MSHGDIATAAAAAAAVLRGDGAAGLLPHWGLEAAAGRMPAMAASTLLIHPP